MWCVHSGGGGMLRGGMWTKADYGINTWNLWQVFFGKCWRLNHSGKFNFLIFRVFQGWKLFFNFLPIRIEILAHRLEQIGNHVICSCVLPKNMTLKAASILVKTGHDLTCFHSEKIFLSLLRCKANDGYFEKLIIEIIRQMIKEMIWRNFFYKITLMVHNLHFSRWW